MWTCAIKILSLIKKVNKRRERAGQMVKRSSKTLQCSLEGVKSYSTLEKKRNKNKYYFTEISFVCNPVYVTH